MASGIRTFMTGIMVLITLAVVVATVIFLGKKPPMQAMEFPPTVVSVAAPECRSISDLYDFTGRTEAVEIADVRARVEGFLQAVSYVDGAKVKKGVKLFEIDPAEYQARCDAFRAQLLSARAQLARSEVDLLRVEKAIRANAVSQEEVTQRKANRDIAAAAVKAAEAALAEAELKLGYTTVASPVDGVVSRNLVDVGSLVGGGEKTLLATVTQMDPMYVYFSVSEDLLLGGLKEIRGTGGAVFMVGTGTGNGEHFEYEGTIDYIDSKVDPATGTVQVRGVVRNPQGTLLPGMFVRVRVPAGQACERMLIDERAVRRDLNGNYILVVNGENVVQQRYVTLGMQVDGKRVVNAAGKDGNGLATGIAPGEQYVVLGVLKARPGMVVTAVPLEGGAVLAGNRPHTDAEVPVTQAAAKTVNK